MPAQSTYRAFFRLHLKGFLIANLLCLVFLFISPYISLVLIIKLFGYLPIYLIIQPWISKYDYYFKNLGVAPVKLFMVISIIDFGLFSIVIAPLRLFF